LLSAGERKVLENHLQAEIAAAVQKLLQDAERQVSAINVELDKRPTSTGVRFRLLSQPLPEGAEGAPIGLDAARKRLLNTSTDLWSAEDRRVVGEMLHQRIAAERSRADALAGGTLLEQLGRALDYRRWHRFRVQRWQDGQWRPLSGPASSGERALGLTVPLFAAVSSYYSQSGYAHAPRLVLLDEAFAGIDDAAREHCMGLIHEFDLDFVITSEREWACYAASCRAWQSASSSAAKASMRCTFHAGPGMAGPGVMTTTPTGASSGLKMRQPTASRAMATDDRLQRLLGGESLAQLRQRLRQRFERGATGAEAQSFRIERLTAAEHAALAALQGRSPRFSASMQVDVDRIDAALRQAGVADSLRAALEQLDGRIVDRAAERASAQTQWRGVIAACEHPALSCLLRTAHGAGLLKRLAAQNPAAAARNLAGADAVLKRLPVHGMTRSQLAAQVLGDAHALDNAYPVATLVLAALRSQLTDAALNDPTDAESEAMSARDLWASAGVLVNELARPALTLNLPGIAVAGEPAYLSLRQLLRAPPQWSLRGRAVFVCENPNLLSIAADRLGARCAPLVCTDGMPAAAQRTLLGQLVQAGAKLRYHGDFDWPGLHIGNHVLRAHGANPWRFSYQDYQAALSTAAAPGRPLQGTDVEAAWDDALAAAMRMASQAIDEEMVADSLLEDLDSRGA
jgi:uncharacterized protein (TIGR02679 family)